MKILVLCPRIPFPPYDGGTIAMASMIRGFSLNRHDVHLLCLNTRKHFVNPENAKPLLPPEVTMEACEIDTKPGIAGAVMNFFQDLPYQVKRFETKDFSGLIESVLKSVMFDLIHVESLFLVSYLPLIRKYSNAPVVLRAHNTEHEIWKGYSENHGGISGMYLRYNAAKLKTLESNISNLFDAIVPISKRDEDSFIRLGNKIKSHVTGVGLELNQYPYHPAETPPASLFHLGALDWLPNLQGLEWFLLKVWPGILKAFPGLKFKIGGRYIPDTLRKFEQEGCIMETEIRDSRSWMHQSGIMVVPLLSGSGIRVKILEGLALGNMIISTNIGISGLGLEHKRHVWIADSPEEFLEGVRFCLFEHEAVKRMRKQARNWVEEHFEINKIATDLSAFYQTLLTNPTS